MILGTCVSNYIPHFVPLFVVVAPISFTLFFFIVSAVLFPTLCLFSLLCLSHRFSILSSLCPCTALLLSLSASCVRVSPASIPFLVAWSGLSFLSNHPPTASFRSTCSPVVYPRYIGMQLESTGLSAFLCSAPTFSVQFIQHLARQQVKVCT